MFHSKMLSAAMAAAIAVAATGSAFASSGENENEREIAAVLGAKTSIAQAIAAAEQQSGGRAMEVDVEKESGAFLYEVKTATQDKITEVLVDPASGKVLRAGDEGLIARNLDREDQDLIAKLTASSTTLAAAIDTAERQTGGRAIEASFDGEDGATLFKVEVAKDNAVHKVRVDGATGKVGKVTVAEHEDEDDDD